MAIHLLARSMFALLLSAVGCCLLPSVACGQSTQPTAHSEPTVSFSNNNFSTQTNDRGDALPEFSRCGYRYSDEALPDVAMLLTVRPSGCDDTATIQRAIDQIAALPVDAQGWRGAVVLSAETFFVRGSIRLYGDHLVLRGSTNGAQTTTIVATGHDRRPLVQVGGKQLAIPRTAKRLIDVAQERHRARIEIDEYVPLGTRKFKVAATEDFRVGQSVLIRMPSTDQWISALGMNRMPTDERGSWLDWKAGAYDQLWLRTVTAMDNEGIELDTALTSALDPRFAQAELIDGKDACEDWASHIGLENLRLISWADIQTNAKDEEHAWDAVRLDRARDAWVRGVTTQQFVGSAVQVGRETRCVTVSDCRSVNPISELAAWRRQTFLTYGQQSLFLRCKAEDGRHDFAVGYLTSGPNAFMQCEALRTSHWSGPLGNWSTGVLYDNVTIDGGGLLLTNRETDAQGAGWAAANCMLWNCVAPQIVCRRPPTAFNWAIGVWGEFTGDGYWNSMNEFVNPSSLMYHQLRSRAGQSIADEVLHRIVLHAPVPVDCNEIRFPDNALMLDRVQSAKPEYPDHRLQLKNGILMLGDRVATGGRLSQPWWRGTSLPAKAAEFGPCLLRYVPGIDARNFTDSVEDIADQMQQRDLLVLEQHWGLWYDRRRDDHQMVRRANADVWAPFYEQPWARSGQGRAWDGLSQYDLTRYNSWYFDRLASFADMADQRGLVLMASMYFQHNILEAGAHWADFAWRPANCLQATGFPEPPVYQNRKRVFMADDFYDVSHPVRRELHTRYIRHCLDVLGYNNNVVWLLSEEYSGPAHFAEFWLQTIQAWEREHNRQVLVVLSVPRDVQDHILSKPDLAAIVDVIDMKYWWPTRDGGLYNPPGGLNLAPRQHLREWKGPKAASAESLARGVLDLRMQYPDKAVLCSVPGADPKLIRQAGGSFTP